MNSIMISVVIAFHQGIDYLRDCLESLKVQTSDNFEVILILDTAAQKIHENVRELLWEYEGLLPIKVHELHGDTGVSAARNLGIEKAEGNFIFFLDSDDYITSNLLYNMEHCMKAQEELCYSKIVHTWFKRDSFHIETMETAKENENATLSQDLAKDRLLSIDKIEDITVLGMLFRKDFLDRYHIRFEKKQKYYADFSFLLNVLEHCEKSSCCTKEEEVYVKRYHNDKIHLPSLEQIEDANREQYVAEAFARGITLSKKYREHVESMACSYYLNVFGRKFHEKPKEAERKFPWMCQVIQLCDRKTLQKFHFIERRILYNTIRKKSRKAGQWIKIRMIQKKIVTMFSDKKHFYRTINLYLFQRMKQKDNWIVFESFVGRNYSGQPKYIYRYLQKNQGKKYRYIWVVNDKKIKIDGKCKKIKRFGLRYYYYMTRSKYWVNNMRQPHSYKKRPGQIMLETWHGTPLKKLVFDMEDVHSASPEYKQIVYEQSRDWDYLLSDNPFSTEKFQSCFLYDREKILELGYPANDPLYDGELDKKAMRLKKKLGIPQDKKVILYAPTWRDDNRYGAGEYKFELKLDWNRLYAELGKEYVILLRMHYWVVDRLKTEGLEGFLFNVSDYSDVTDLYIISDICITDYSSVFFDYANLRRPILFYMYDLEKYRDMLRGFYLDIYKDLPGPVLTEESQLIDAIKNIERTTEAYQKRYQIFYDRFCGIDDGNAAKRVCETVFYNKIQG